jgi:hypothetical protein
MRPYDLKPEHFANYPPEARKLITNHLKTVQVLPLTYVANLLREVVEYDFRFPVERRELEKELANAGALTPEEKRDWFQGFAAITLSPELEKTDWPDRPARFVEQLSAFLWTTHQLDSFRKAALDYAERLHRAVPPEQPPIPRLGIAVIGQGVATFEDPLFNKLREHGAYFNKVKPDSGLEFLLNAIGKRAQDHPIPYGHWYIDGGSPGEHAAELTCVSYQGLATVREALLRKMRPQIDEPGMGPEALRTFLAQVTPGEVGLRTNDPILDRFQVKLFTEGSGTQIFSTTFAQWAAREALRRAQPCTLLVRFTPRQRQKSMNELLSENQNKAELDPVGSLIDADLGAYYNWINQQRLSGEEKSSFLAWFENHSQAILIGPTIPRGTQSSAETDLAKLLSWTLKFEA